MSLSLVPILLAGIFAVLVWICLRRPARPTLWQRWRCDHDFILLLDPATARIRPYCRRCDAGHPAMRQHEIASALWREQVRDRERRRSA